MQPQTINEVDFCAKIASHANGLFTADHSLPFGEARIEGYGSATGKMKRKDLRFYDRTGNLILTGETKLPGTVDGRSPYSDALVRDAFGKAEDANVRFFFTWNVNIFVLWDRQLWDVPLLERRVREWRLDEHLASPRDVAVPIVLDHIARAFFPSVLRDVAAIYHGQEEDWGMTPDDLFIRSLDSHLEWPAQLTRDWLLSSSLSDKALDTELQSWMQQQDWSFVRSNPEEWRIAVNRAARTLTYILANRLIFYQALKARFHELPTLVLGTRIQNSTQAYDHLQDLFERAVERSGDYQTLLYPHERDWASAQVFEAPGAIDAWRSAVEAINDYNFQTISSDIVGRVFQRLVSPEERKRYGQHFTADDVVDLINAFCIYSGSDAVLDPACGSGSFLVRAYYRKRMLDPKASHSERLSQLYGSEIALYPAHLATLNLAAREITEAANFPRIARRDFFTIDSNEPFCELPSSETGESEAVFLPVFDAIVGNPPYLEQRRLSESEKNRLSEMANARWSKLTLSKRSDVYVYFWTVAAALLKEGGYFGFLTTSSWLDVEYGFPLQGWLLQNFRILAVIESTSEPWFTDARVKTCATILQRTSDSAGRAKNFVRFVQLRKPISLVAGLSSKDDETRRQQKFEALRDKILVTTESNFSDTLRVIVRVQEELWAEGVRASELIGHEADDEEDEADD